MTWQGWLSLLSTIATTLSPFGRMHASDLVLRVLMLASAPLWAAHDLFVGSLPGRLNATAVPGARARQRIPNQIRRIARDSQLPLRERTGARATSVQHRVPDT